MNDVDKLLIDNLKANLDHAQRHVVRSIGSALLLLVLISAVPDLREQGASFEVPMLGPIGPDWAGVIFMVACLVLGTLAVAAVSRASTIVKEISEPRLAVAALTYPSIVTSRSRTLRVGATMLAPAFLIASYLVEQGRGDSPVTFFTLVGIGLFSLPFFLLAGRLWFPIEARPTDTADSQP